MFRREVVYECITSLVERLQSPVDFWRTRGGHQNSRTCRVNRIPNNHRTPNVKHSSSAVNDPLHNSVGPNAMATIITDDDDLNNEMIQLVDAKQWTDDNKSQTFNESSHTKQKIKRTTLTECSNLPPTVAQNEQDGEESSLSTFVDGSNNINNFANNIINGTAV